MNALFKLQWNSLFSTVLAFSLLIPTKSTGQSSHYPKIITQALNRAGSNRQSLEKSILHFQSSGEPKKLSALYFLISNMDAHQSVAIVFSDSSGKVVPYNQLDYQNVDSSLVALKALKKKHRRLAAGLSYHNDLETISGDFLIEHINASFKAWENGVAKNVRFRDFCEYILPYRVSNESVQNWSSAYGKRFSWVNDSLKTIGVIKTLAYVTADNQNWFKNPNGTFAEIYRRLGAQELLFRSMGACEDRADAAVFTLRSQGIPASVNAIPFWGTSSGLHYCVSVFDPSMKLIRYDPTREIVDAELLREPSKVIRETFSKQSDALAKNLHPDSIPSGFLQSLNYKDITEKYWKTSSIKIPVEKEGVTGTLFACVYNDASWRPTWWGKVKNRKVRFDKMPKGAVYLPMYYYEGDLIPAGYPIANGFDRQILLRPDSTKLRSVTLNEQEKYLIYRPGSKYKLFYWDRKWNLCGELPAEADTHSLTFEKVPDNALLVLVPSYTSGKDRPFIINANGERAWW